MGQALRRPATEQTQRLHIGQRAHWRECPSEQRFIASRGELPFAGPYLSTLHLGRTRSSQRARQAESHARALASRLAPWRRAAGQAAPSRSRPPAARAHLHRAAEECDARHPARSHANASSAIYATKATAHPDLPPRAGDRLGRTTAAGGGRSPRGDRRSAMAALARAAGRGGRRAGRERGEARLCAAPLAAATVGAGAHARLGKQSESVPGDLLRAPPPARPQHLAARAGGRRVRRAQARVLRGGGWLGRADLAPARASDRLAPARLPGERLPGARLRGARGGAHVHPLRQRSAVGQVAQGRQRRKRALPHRLA
mmetsp:Transcript_31563/g.73552  ORF Transcript_31563/g.73552 Transcript_31563/m.73552 type:complete len:315 (+) Transcript_31563:762-1706(+)